MKRFVGLDVSQATTAICVVDADGKTLAEGVTATEPGAIAAFLRRRAPDAERIGLETGPLSVWLWNELRALGLPVICMDARHANAGLKVMLAKTDQRRCRPRPAGPHRMVPPGAHQGGEQPHRARRAGDADPAGPDALRPREPDPRRTENLRPRHRQGAEPARQARARDRRRRAFRQACARKPGGKPACHAVECGRADRGARPRAEGPGEDHARLPSLYHRPRRRADHRACHLVEHRRPGTLRPVARCRRLFRPDAPALRLGRDEPIRTHHQMRRRHVRTLLYEAANVLLVKISRDLALRSWGLGIAQRSGFKKAKVRSPASSPCSCTASGATAPSSAGVPNPPSPERRGPASIGSSPPGRRRRASAIPRTAAGTLVRPRTPLRTVRVRERQPGTAMRADPVENHSPGGCEQQSQLLTVGIREPAGHDRTRPSRIARLATDLVERVIVRTL